MMVMKKPCGEEGPVVSVTVTMKVNVPGVVGVPEITPEVGLRFSPGGGEPLVTAQLQGHVSGAATRVVEYGVPTCPLGKELGRMVGAAWTGPTKKKTVLRMVSRQINARQSPGLIFCLRQRPVSVRLNFICLRLL
jgi:hypothetical protein